MTSSRFLAAAAALLLCFASPAFAHDDAYLATLKAPHGGELRMAGPYHYELVAGRAASDSSESVMAVYVTDHAGTPVPTKGAQGFVHAMGNERDSVDLVPDGANRMKAVGAPAWKSDAGMVVSITIAGEPPAQARFARRAVEASESAPSHGAGAAHGH